MILVLGLILLGCVQTEEVATEPLDIGDNISMETEDASKIVHIKNFAFNPPEVTIKQGETITWVNEDSVAHTIKVGELFESPHLQKGDEFDHTFTEAIGEYPYICGIHPSMQGKVKVV